MKKDDNKEKAVNECKTWQTVLTIPAYLIREISGAGTYEMYKNGELFESDDLRITIIVSGGHAILIPLNGRLCIEKDGSISVEVLMVVEQ